MNFELRQGGKGDRPMRVEILRDSASTRRQRRRNLKGEGYSRNQFNLIQGGGAQTVQIVRHATTTQNQIKLLWLY